MTRLSDDQRKQFEALRNDGARLDHMASALGVSVDAIKGRLYRARHGHAKRAEPIEPVGFGWESDRDLRRAIWERARRAAAEARTQCQ